MRISDMGVRDRGFADPTALGVDVNGNGWLDPNALLFSVNEGTAKIHIERRADGFYVIDPLGRRFPQPAQLTPRPAANNIEHARKADQIDGSGFGQYTITSMATPLTPSVNWSYPDPEQLVPIPPKPKPKPKPKLDPILELRKELERVPVEIRESDNPLDYLTEEDQEFFRFNGVDPSTLRGKK